MRDLTQEEQTIVEACALLWNKILELPEVHKQDNIETCRDIHDIQNRILSRPAKEELKK